MTDPTPRWTPEELDAIAASDELRIAPVKRDGTLRTALPIWAVRVGDDVYVRAAYGPSTGWHRVARAQRAAHVAAGAASRDVVVEDAPADVNDAVDAAYRTKYQRYAANIVDSVTDEQARATTLRLVPRG